MKTYEIIVDENGTKYWLLNGDLHREDGPAIELADGTKRWYLNGKLHRENGPAAEFADGSKCWHLNGKLHREDGPAVEQTDGTKRWYLNGVRLSEVEFNRQTRQTRQMTIEINGKKYRVLEIQD